MTTLTPALTPAQRAAIPPALQRAAREFETQAMAALLKPAFATVRMTGGTFGGSSAEEQWRPMLVDAFAAKALQAGQGLGLTDAILRELLRRQAGQNASTENPA